MHWNFESASESTELWRYINLSIIIIIIIIIEQPSRSYFPIYLLVTFWQPVLGLHLIFPQENFTGYLTLCPALATDLIVRYMLSFIRLD